MPGTEARRLRELAAERVDDAVTVFASTEEFHGVLSRIVGAIAARQPPPVEAVDGLNAVLASTTPRRRLVPTRRRLDWVWPEDPQRTLFRPLWAVAQSAMDLLTSATCEKVRRCAAEGCGVFFVTDGPGMPRKFCSVTSCGNPSRAREYYRRVTKPTLKANRLSSRK